MFDKKKVFMKLWSNPWKIHQDAHFLVKLLAQEHGNRYFLEMCNTISKRFISGKRFIEHLSVVAWKGIFNYHFQYNMKSILTLGRLVWDLLSSSLKEKSFDWFLCDWHTRFQKSSSRGLCAFISIRFAAFPRTSNGASQSN